MASLPFGRIGGPRRPCQWAALHAGVEFLPELDRSLLNLRQLGYSVEVIAVAMVMDPLEVERSIARSSRTLITWERNACKWANRFVAIEPMVAELGDNRERVSQARPGSQRSVQGKRV